MGRISGVATKYKFIWFVNTNVWVLIWGSVFALFAIQELYKLEQTRNELYKNFAAAVKNVQISNMQISKPKSNQISHVCAHLCLLLFISLDI